MKTKTRDLRETFTSLTTLAGKPSVNFDEKPSDYLCELLEKAIETIQKSKLSSLETTNPSPKDTETDRRLAEQSLGNTCIFRVEFSQEEIVICMKDFDRKGSIHKMPTKACDNHYLTSIIQPTDQKQTKPYIEPIKPYIPKQSKVPFISSRPATFCPTRQILIDPKKCEVCKEQKPTDYELCQERKQGNTLKTNRR